MEIKGVGQADQIVSAKKVKPHHEVEKPKTEKAEAPKEEKLEAPKPVEKADSQKVAEGVESKKTEGKGQALDVMG